MKKLFIILLIMFFLLSIGCGQSQNQIQKDVKKLLEYDFSYNDISKINNKLCNQKYSYTTKANKKIISVITLDNGKAHVKEYEVFEDGVIDIEIPSKQFIISFHANSTVLYTWNIKNSNDLKMNEIIEIKNKDKIKIPFESNDVDGENYDRENFLFEAKKEGTQKIIFRYEHSENSEALKDEYFEIIINLTVN
ncbi:protease inhibitor I42 family protein [Oceanirhabdus seepicola]|uniref:Protease inhibitor I42 family protein n=1 Tax=Oceanirhabdus seepicola TaxID=2828781 RepID=A0A9J6NYK1_9CLOT|nr:protease inhibitor I42 family protein [Oceanirhabdus seepicola]MCM1988224.1 protease inhibitor I42 family protein [Oceanirhabdus seepicola]